MNAQRARVRMAPSPEQPQEPAAFYAPSALNTVDDVVVFGTGPGAEALRGTIDNTALFGVIRNSF